MNTLFTRANFRALLITTILVVFCNFANAQCTTETVWNGNVWSNGTPTISVKAVIAGDFTSANNLSACSLKVISGAQATFTENTTLTVKNDIEVDTDSKLIINNNASLVQLTDAAVNTGNVTVKRNSSALYRLDYTLWSAPVSGQNLLAFSVQTSTNRFYQYQYSVEANSGTASGQYFNVDALTNNFQPAQAYLIRMPNTDTTTGYNTGTAALTFKGSFTGIANNGVITRALTTVGERYTAVGNPYASPVNIADFFAANSDVLDAGAALYFWRKKNETNAGSYATITKDAYVYNHTDGSSETENQFGGEQWDELFNASTSEEDWVINTGQGFIVKGAQGIANPVITFNNAMRRGNVHNNQFFRNAQPNDAQKSRVWINLKGNNAFSQTAIVYSNTATLGIDYGRDGEQITSGAVALYSIADETNLTIQARPEFTAADIVPMGYVANTAGTFTLSVHRADGVFDSGQEIYIRDNVTGTVHNLATDYTFTTTEGTFNERFEVAYRLASLSTETPLATSRADVTVYNNNGVITVAADNVQILSVNIYDINGRELYSNAKVHTTETNITGLQAAQQLLMVNVTTKNGTVSRKVIF